MKLSDALFYKIYLNYDYVVEPSLNQILSCLKLWHNVTKREIFSDLRIILCTDKEDYEILSKTELVHELHNVRHEPGDFILMCPPKTKDDDLYLHVKGHPFDVEKLKDKKIKEGYVWPYGKVRS